MGSLAHYANENDIKEYFGAYGDVILVDLKRNLKGRSRGFAFVVFKEVETLNKVLAKQGHMIKGRKAYCDKAIRGGGNRGGFRGGRGESFGRGSGRGLKTGRGGFRGGNRVGRSDTFSDFFSTPYSVSFWYSSESLYSFLLIFFLRRANSLDLISFSSSR